MKLIINHKKKLCLVLVLILTMFTAFPMESIMAKNEDKSSGKKDYIVIAKDSRGYQNQSNKQKDKINKEKSNKKTLKGVIFFRGYFNKIWYTIIMHR